MHIKMPAFDHIKHLTGLGSCRERDVSQEGAEAAVPSVVTHVVVRTAVCSSAGRLGCLQVHSFAVVTYREGGEFAGFNMAWLNLLRVFNFLHALFKALKCDCGLTSSLYAKAVQRMPVRHGSVHVEQNALQRVERIPWWRRQETDTRRS